MPSLPIARSSGCSPEYRFTPSGTGTQVTFSLRAELGGLKKLLMSGPVQKTMDGEMQALDAAKAQLEGE